MSRPGFRLVMLLPAVALAGCSEAAINSVSVNPTPRSILEPEAPPEPKAATEKKAGPGPNETPPPAPPDPKKAGPAASGKPLALRGALSVALAPGPEAADGVVRLAAIKFEDLKGKIANPRAKLTMVDVWSTTCGPCMENFPHLVQMQARYSSRGLAVISLTMDPPDDAQAIRRAEGFLREQKAAFTNLRLDEDPAVAYEQLDFFALPAVFLYGPDGTLVKKFTMDDPNHQFTYADVEKDVEARLEAASSGVRKD